jgi:hypothetical protein
MLPVVTCAQDSYTVFKTLRIISSPFVHMCQRLQTADRPPPAGQHTEHGMLIALP